MKLRSMAFMSRNHRKPNRNSGCLRKAPSLRQVQERQRHRLRATSPSRVATATTGDRIRRGALVSWSDVPAAVNPAGLTLISEAPLSNGPSRSWRPRSIRRARN